MTPMPRLPAANELTYRQHQGWACVWCSASLWTREGGVSVGRAWGRDGSSIEVYACPGCVAAGGSKVSSPARTPIVPVAD